MVEKDEEKDEEALLQKRLDEMRKKKSTANPSMNALIVQGSVADDEFGGVEVWSTDSEDDEVRKPSHGKACVAKEESSGGRCLMVSEVSQMRGYNTDDRSNEPKEQQDMCFTAKPLSVQFNELDELIKKGVFEE
ncbi:uncharacterized protein LOC128133027 [Lactuca sativa]|uniref:uncharacterized protein LOC128133027 n=1 Tax=Lactuca sativa TaxID=4236 RepID=UPI0022AEA152|nr:uncharacterized protein LOC128133027 [Lactuca sativa]